MSISLTDALNFLFGWQPFHVNVPSTAREADGQLENFNYEYFVDTLMLNTRWTRIGTRQDQFQMHRKNRLCQKFSPLFFVPSSSHEEKIGVNRISTKYEYNQRIINKMGAIGNECANGMLLLLACWFNCTFINVDLYRILILNKIFPFLSIYRSGQRVPTNNGWLGILIEQRFS